MSPLSGLLAAALALAAAPGAGHDDGAWTVRLPTSSTSGDHQTVPTRLEAARTILRSRFSEIGPSEPLLVAWLASRADLMAIASDSERGTLVVTCDQPDRLAEATRALSSLVLEYGTPIVAIEPERPTSLDDRRLSSALQSALTDIGLRTVDGTAARESRRAAVDRAVDRGLDGLMGRKTLDHLDTDFIARIENRSSAPRREMVYGVDLHIAERISAITLMRAQVDSLVASWQDTTLRRSQSPKAAERDAEASAVSSATASLLAAIAEDWIALATGARPWLVEVLHPSEDPTLNLGLKSGSAVKLLEYRPGVRAVMEVAPSDLPQRGGSFAFGPTIRQRPGALLVASDASSSPRAWLVATASILGLAVAAGVLALWRSRMKRRSTSSLG